MASIEKTTINPELFEPVGHREFHQSDEIAAPSLTFMQDSWRRLKKIVERSFHYFYYWLFP